MGDDHKSIKLTAGYEIPLLESSEPIEGKIFSGWVYGTNIAFSGEADWTSLAEAATGSTNEVKKIVFKAQYDKEKYFIKYINADEDYIRVHYEGSNDNFYAQEVLYGNNSPQVYPPSVKYYTFGHWEYGKNASNSDNPYKTANFQIGNGDVDWTKLSTKIGAGNVILVKAIYSPIKYIINYKDGESDAEIEGGAQADYTADKNTLDSVIPDAFKNGIKTGYRFNRWMYVNVLGRRCKLIPGRTKWRNLLDGATADNEIILWADYGPIEYTITYDAGDESKVSSGAYMPSDSGGNQTSNPATISTEKPTKTGYYFEKWTYGDGEKETDFTANSTTWEQLISSAALSDDGKAGTITLKANFAPITYDIEYIDDEKSRAGGSKNPGSYTSDSTFSLDSTPELDNGSKLGYAFSHWTYGSNTSFTTGGTKWKDLVSRATLSDDGKTGTITLKANFAPKTYTIKYQTNSYTNFDDETYTTNEEGK